MNKVLLVLCCTLCLISLTACPKQIHETQEQPASQYTFTKDGSLTIHDSHGTELGLFDIEIASTVIKRQIGLMYRESMESNQGMLFEFDEIDTHGFWMKNTYLPLDIIFIDADKNIVEIAENTTPFSEETIIPQKPIKYVLELKSGTSKQMNIQAGNKVSW
ncbi:MAG: hypothetical protein CVU48_00900 [Candidatus Cloacimonetes bacterium HGW-Cloacimonetes-1]|jgi:hypothetical protein|nr:MAG: hypothetical protein CVU48_00900 [Candidatus Cloacimonetes bacterium HGW-Cloacimonetes-1]